MNDTWSFGRATINARRPLRPLRRAGCPEQKQLAATTGPVSVAGARRSRRPRSTRGTRRAAHRRSSTTSPATARPSSRPTTASSGTTRVWASASNANPNTAAKRPPTRGTTSTATSTGSPAKQGALQRRRRSRARSSSIRTSRTPYTHEAAFWLERQLTDTMGMRAGFVYKTEDDLIAHATARSCRCSAYTRALHVHGHRRGRPRRHRGRQVR